MNNIDTIYMNGDLLVEKLSNHNDDTLFIIKQVTESNGVTVTAITLIICGTIVLVMLLWLVWKIVQQLIKNYDAKKERLFKERERLIKLKQEYQARLLEEYTSYKTICKVIEGAIEEQNCDCERLNALLQKNIEDKENYTEQLKEYRYELNERIEALNGKLGITYKKHNQTSNDNRVLRWWCKRKEQQKRIISHPIEPHE